MKKKKTISTEKTITPVLKIIYHLQTGIKEVQKSKSWNNEEKELIISTISFILNNIHEQNILGDELQCFKNAIELGRKQALQHNNIEEYFA